MRRAKKHRFASECEQDADTMVELSGHSTCLYWDSDFLEEVDEFIYPGSLMTRYGGSAEDVANRLKKARHVFLV